MPRSVGIDLGTTNCCVAIFEGGEPRVVTFGAGDRTIPSVFAIDEAGNRLVGAPALRQAVLNPFHTVIGSKRLIGRNYRDRIISRVRKLFTYRVLEGPNKDVNIQVRESIFSPQQIAAAILEHVKAETERALGEVVTSAVITVPAYFNERQRGAVRSAAESVGLQVLRIVNEPTAAALGFGFGRDRPPQRIAVYDLGGGTFDISIIDLHDDMVEVIATGGDTFLGGVDFDDRVVDHVLDYCAREHRVDLTWNRAALQRIRDAAEIAKKNLSARMATQLNLPFLAWSGDDRIDLDLEITRAELETLTADLVTRTLNVCKRIFHEAGAEVSEVKDVLLVGGQTRMPLVQALVSDFLGRAPSKQINPDEAVALGAAVLARSLTEPGSKSVVLLDVAPMAIGVGREDGTMDRLFKKNQHVPDMTRKRYTCPAGGLRLEVFQGESIYTKENEQLGVVTIPAAGAQRDVEVSYNLDIEGILSVTGKTADGEVVAVTFSTNLR